MQCRKCGTTNRQGAKFCAECGTSFTSSCPACGTVVQLSSKFCSECGAPLTPQSRVPGLETRVQSLQVPLQYTPSHLAQRILSSKAAMEGERKIVTVLFADIKGSMDMMEDLDPEEAKELLDPCLRLMIEAVHRAEGTVNRLLGDGLMALFGAPLALEDHPHRALYAASRMHEAIQRYADDVLKTRGLSLQIRVGVNTGEVVVRTITNDLYMDYSAVGHAVGLAARMENVATPGSTFVTAYTYRLAQDAFRFAARGTVKVKGVREPLEVYELLSPRTSYSRLATRSTRGLTPFIGRTREFSEVCKLTDLARQGRGQVVALVGEAGVGKSRLLEELKPSLREQGFLFIEGAGFAYGKTRAYLPLVDMLKRYCGITDQDPTGSYRDKLYQQLAVVDHVLSDYVSVFLDLFGVDSNDPQTASLPGEAKLLKVLDGIKRLIALQSRHQPVALIIEDLHWLDSRSVTFLHALITGIVALPVVFLFSYRPERTYPWETLSFSHRLQITPLHQEASTSLFASLVGNDPAVATLVPLVYTQSGGNPFFLEEIVQSLTETGTLVGQPQAYTLRHPLLKWTLPATVYGVLASRLDRLSPPIKAVLQTAAVIGREFARPLLARVAGLAEGDLDHALSVLQSREFLHETTVYPDIIYTFKHALTQEVAYQSLLRERRAELHAQVGAAIEELYGDKLSEYVTVLAHHYSHSAHTEKALQYLNLAAKHAFDLYADSDALHFWEEFLHILATLPPGRERDYKEVRTRLHLINVLSRQNSDDGSIRRQFAAAEAVCQRLTDNRLLIELHATLAVAYVLWGRPQPGLLHARTASDLANSLGEVHLQIITRGPLAHLLWIAGQFAEGLHVAEEGLSLLQQHRLLDEQMDFIAYPYVQCLAIAGACRGFLGDLDQGLYLLQEAVQTAKRHGNRIPQALSFWGLALLHSLRGDNSAALHEAENALALMQEVSSSTGILLTGCIQEYLAAMISIAKSVAPPPTSLLLQTWQERCAFCELAGTQLAEIELFSGHSEEAVQLAREALVCAEASDSTWFLCMAHTILGRVLGHTRVKDYAGAEVHLSQALQYAETMRSDPLCSQILVEIGEVLYNKSRETREDRNSESPQTHNAARAQVTTRADAEHRARESLLRAVEICTRLKLDTYLQRAHLLLAQLAGLFPPQENV